MTKISYIVSLAVILSSLAMSSCGDDEPSKTELPGNAVPFDSNSDREYLEKTANTFLSYFNSNDQRESIVAMNEFVKLCSTYTLPDNYVDGRYNDLQKSAAQYAKAATESDYIAMSRATTELVYNLARFSGLYQANPNTLTWDRIEDRDHIDFRFWIGATEYNITLQGNSGSWSDSYTNAEYTYNVEMPKNLTINMYRGSTQPFTSLMNFTITSDVKNNDYANIKISGSFANLVVESSIKATSTKITESTAISVEYTNSRPRTQIIASETNITGHDLCSAAVWDNIINDGNDEHKSALIGDIVNLCSNTLLVLENVQLKSSASDVSALIDYTDGYWDKSNSPNPEQSAKDAANHLSKTFTSQMFFAGDKNLVRGTIGWEAYQSYDDPNYTEWALRPTITLASDGSVTDFESFFGKGRFFSVERNFQTLMDGYKSYWK